VRGVKLSPPLPRGVSLRGQALWTGAATYPPPDRAPRLEPCARSRAQPSSTTWSLSPRSSPLDRSRHLSSSRLSPASPARPPTRVKATTGGETVPSPRMPASRPRIAARRPPGRNNDPRLPLTPIKGGALHSRRYTLHQPPEPPGRESQPGDLNPGVVAPRSRHYQTFQNGATRRNVRAHDSFP